MGQPLFITVALAIAAICFSLVVFAIAVRVLERKSGARGFEVRGVQVQTRLGTWISKQLDQAVRTIFLESEEEKAESLARRTEPARETTPTPLAQVATKPTVSLPPQPPELGVSLPDVELEETLLDELSKLISTPPETVATDTEAESASRVHTADAEVAKSQPVETAPIRVSEPKRKPNPAWDELWDIATEKLVHLRVVAPTGGGKTTLCRALMSGLLGKGHKFVVISVKAPKDAWGVKPIGVPSKMEDIRKALVLLLGDLQQRNEDLSDQTLKEFDTTHEHVWVFVDESMYIAMHSHTQETWEQFYFEFSSLARELKMHLVTMGQDKTVRATGTEGIGGIRENLALLLIDRDTHAYSLEFGGETFYVPDTRNAVELSEQLDLSSHPEAMYEMDLDFEETEHWKCPECGYEEGVDGRWTNQQKSAFRCPRGCTFKKASPHIVKSARRGVST